MQSSQRGPLSRVRELISLASRFSVNTDLQGGKLPLEDADFWILLPGLRRVIVRHHFDLSAENRLYFFSKRG